MRIISGNFKGKKIYQPLDKKTRPLRDMVKGLFSIYLFTQINLTLK